MKKIIFIFLFLLSCHCAETGSFEKNGVAMQYGTCQRIKIDYRNLPRIGSPYCITVTNNAKTAISIDASLIDEPQYSLDEIAKYIRLNWKFAAAIFTIGAPILAYLAHSIYGIHLESQKVPKIATQTILDKVSVEKLELLWSLLLAGEATISAGFGPFLFYKLVKETNAILKAKLGKEVLHKSITIQPGKSVKKLFWLKNPKDQIEINFDAVKVLK